MKKLVLLTLTAVLMLSGCDKEPVVDMRKAEPDVRPIVSKTTVDVVTPVEIADGLWHFDCWDVKWVNSFAYFKQTHPELRVIGSIQGKSGGYGAPMSYLVITEKK